MQKIKKIVLVTIIAMLSSLVSVSASTTINLPSNVGSLHTYTVWDKIKWSGDCRQLISFTKGWNSVSDSYGIVKYGEWFAGALTSTYGKVGDMLLVIQNDNSVYPVIMADTKNQNDEGCNKWGHQGGKCVVEFEILKAHKKSLYGKSGGYVGELLAKPVKQIINIGSVYNGTYYFWNPKLAAIDNGLVGSNLIISPYESIMIEDDKQVLTDNMQEELASIVLANDSNLWFADYFDTKLIS